MLWARLLYQKKEYWGKVEDHQFSLVTGSPFGTWEPLEKRIICSEAVFLPPCKPSKIVCIGLNYRDHASELNMPLPEEPLIFLKPPSAVIGHKAGIVYPQESSRVDYEAELAIIIKETATRIEPDKVWSKILGYTCSNDITARDLQKKDIQWTRAKSFDTFCPLGPYLATDLDPKALKITLKVNGLLKQDSSTEEMIFSIPYLISFISKIMTLLPGDVILTGTPKGVGSLNRGDTVEVEIQGIGKLINTVVVHENNIKK